MAQWCNMSNTIRMSKNKTTCSVYVARAKIDKSKFPSLSNVYILERRKFVELLLSDDGLSVYKMHYFLRDGSSF